MIVLDASVAIEGLLRPGPSRTLMAEVMIQVPHITDCEIGSALADMARRGEVKPDRARQALETWAVIGVRRHPVTGVLDRVWELRHNVTAYDASYVALAEWLELPLVTRDKRLSRAPGINCEVRLMED